MGDVERLPEVNVGEVHASGATDKYEFASFERRVECVPFQQDPSIRRTYQEESGDLLGIYACMYLQKEVIIMAKMSW